MMLICLRAQPGFQELVIKYKDIYDDFAHRGAIALKLKEVLDRKL